MRKKRRYTETFNIRLDPETLNTAKECARTNKQSLSKWLRDLIAKEIAEEERIQGEMMCFLDWHEHTSPAERERVFRRSQEQAK